MSGQQDSNLNQICTDVIAMTERYKERLEQAVRRERDKRGFCIVDAQKFDRTLIDLMQYFHERLPASIAHAGIAAFMRGILEGAYGDESGPAAHLS